MSTASPLLSTTPLCTTIPSCSTSTAIPTPCYHCCPYVHFAILSGFFESHSSAFEYTAGGLPPLAEGAATDATLALGLAERFREFGTYLDTRYR